MSSASRNGPDDYLQAAADWVVREAESDFSPQDAQALADWRARDERHEQAYAEVKGLWSEMASLDHLAERYPLADPVAVAAANDDGGPPARSVWRGVWPAGMAAAAAAVLAVVFLPGRGETSAVYTTDIGQISEITLEDGSVATLGPKTRIDVTFTDDQRHISLANGEAFFSVTSNKNRPFVVQTGASAVRVVGTQFNVRRNEGAVQVAVLQGTVQIRESSPKTPGRPLGTLRRGDSADVSLEPGGRVKISNLGHSDGGAQFGDLAAGWRKGWLVYDGARLADIVADMNRYYRPGVAVVEPGLADMRVTASFKAEAIPQFVSSLDDLFPVAVEQQADGGYRIRAN